MPRVLPSASCLGLPLASWLGLSPVQGCLLSKVAICPGCCHLSRVLPPVQGVASYPGFCLLSRVLPPASCTAHHVRLHTTLCSWKANRCRRADARNGIVLDYTKDALRQIPDRRNLHCKQSVWPESIPPGTESSPPRTEPSPPGTEPSPPGTDPHIASSACQHVTADTYLLQPQSSLPNTSPECRNPFLLSPGVSELRLPL